MKAFILASALGVLVLSATAQSFHQVFATGPDDGTLEFVKNKAGAVDEKDDMECTALHYAARYGRLKTAQWLIAHKADVNTVSYNGFTPMHMVSDSALAKLLVEAGADLHKKDSWGNTPMKSAAQEGRTNICEVILASGFPMDLTSALWIGRRDVAKQIIKDNPGSVTNIEEGSNLWGNTSPLGVAAAQGDKEMVELLLEAGAPVNAITEIPNTGPANALCNAVWNKHYGVAQLLCKSGADCNMIGGRFYPRLLDYALRHSDRKTVNLLIKYGATAGIKGRHVGEASRTWAVDSPIGRIGVHEVKHWTDAAGQPIALWESNREDKPSDKPHWKTKVLLVCVSFSVPVSVWTAAFAAAAGLSTAFFSVSHLSRIRAHAKEQDKSMDRVC
jgi:ankyrin repeat protein